MITPVALSLSQARRLALGAQGFADPRPTGRVDRRHLRRIVSQMGLIQIDSVNVLARSQELVVFARLGPHRRSLIPDATAAGELFEYWAHEASHVSTTDYPLYRWAMDSAARSRRLERWGQDHAALLDEIEAYVADHGPIVASDVRQESRPNGPWWDWDDGKRALEALFIRGRITATRRQRDFARLYDLPDRVIPAHVLNLPVPSEHDARKQLLRQAAASCGVGTLEDLADYHRQRRPVVRPLIDELVEAGELIPAEVEGWDEIAYLHPQATTPRSIKRCALLSPFDPVVWYRDRAERLFDFHYRIEIYIPPAQRRYGYFVLPVLLGEHLVGRVDLKADRQAGALLVRHAWIEAGYEAGVVAPAIIAELDLMAAWLGLERVEIEPAGDLAPALLDEQSVRRSH
ncbi:MAG: cytoplasmic protein [Ilumatobacter coccineus]|uniref:Cytoplasmic protein n=1 Tax=Ilumatobacter coccineus TaxID=467094 RepID=A0A2G6KFD9_9ACTN|nr:MAG: cytoplasmic protein [Ilumatobacter coccineus]